MAWGYNASITTDHTQCGTADTSNFEYSVRGVYDGTDGKPDLRTVANGGNVQNTNGYDICFYSDSDLTTQLSHEMKSYNPVTGEIEAWVRIPTLHYGSDEVFYIAYGDSSISTSQENITDIWDQHHVFAYHMNDATTSTLGDSTSNGFTGAKGSANNPAEATGIIGKGQDFSSDYVSISDSGDKLDVTRLTIMFWMTIDSQGAYQTSVRRNGPSGNIFFIQWTSGGTYFRGGVRTTGEVIVEDDTTPLSTATPYLLGMTYDGSNIRLWINGQNVKSSGSVSGDIGSSTSDFIIGAHYPDGYYIDGIVDEFRFMGSAMTASYMLAAYNNQKPSSTFYTMGSETAVGTSTYTSPLPAFRNP